MKRILYLLIVFSLTLSCVSCGKNTETIISDSVSNESHTESDTTSKGDATSKSDTTSTGNTTSKSDTASKSDTTSKGEESRIPSSSSGTTQKPVAEHTHNYTKQTVASTCSANGYTLYYCDCGDSYKNNITSPNYNHNFKFADSSQLDYICSKCSLKVCEHGNADGYLSGGLPIKYYITGSYNSSGTSRTLVIYGQGKMPDFNTGHMGRPMWDGSFIHQVNKIIIADGITSIGKYSFYNPEDKSSYPNIKTIQMADSVKDIYPYALYGITKLSPKQMILGNGVTHIYSNSLPKSGFSVQYFPKSLQYIDEDYNFSIFTYYQGTEEEYFNIKIQHGPYVNSYITMRELKKIIENGGSSFIMPFCNVKLNSNGFVNV